MESQTIANNLEKYVFAFWGLFDKMISGNATVFTSELMEELCKKLNITKRTIVPYNPQSNSVERERESTPGTREDFLSIGDGVRELLG